MIISKNIYDSMLRYCYMGLPFEVCGYLAGIRESGKQKTNLLVQKHYPIENVAKSPSIFRMNSSEQFEAFKDAKKNGLSLLACYHSHPGALAKPSVLDIEGASDPYLIYLIVSLLDYQKPQVKAFWIQDDQVKIEPIMIQMNHNLASQMSR